MYTDLYLDKRIKIHKAEASSTIPQKTQTFWTLPFISENMSGNIYVILSLLRLEFLLITAFFQLL